MNQEDDVDDDGNNTKISIKFCFTSKMTLKITGGHKRCEDRSQCVKVYATVQEIN